MARGNKSKYALLGMLSWKPMSGYDIKKTITHSLGYFWSESYGQIYPIMKSLAEEGLASFTVEAQDGKPDRHLYSITDKGREELERWLLTPPAPHKERFELLLKLFFSNRLPRTEALRHIERFRSEQLALSSEYAAIERNIAANEGTGDLFPLLTLRAGIHSSRAWLDWCAEAIERISALPEQPEPEK